MAAEATFAAAAGWCGLALLEPSRRCAHALGAAPGILLPRCRAAVPGEAARGALDPATGRVAAIALVHRAVEPEEGGIGGTTVEPARCFPRLAGRLRAAHLTPLRLGCRLTIDPGRVGPAVERTSGWSSANRPATPPSMVTSRAHEDGYGGPADPPAGVAVDGRRRWPRRSAHEALPARGGDRRLSGPALVRAVAAGPGGRVGTASGPEGLPRWACRSARAAPTPSA